MLQIVLLHMTGLQRFWGIGFENNIYYTGPVYSACGGLAFENDIHYTVPVYGACGRLYFKNDG